MESSDLKYGGSALFKLRPLSKLRIYMANKTGLDKNQYSLQELLEMLKDIIHTEEMVNTSNHTMTTCPQNLEQALNIKTLYVDEIRDVIWSHLTEKSVKSVDTAVTTARDTTENAVVEQAVSSGSIEEILHTSMIEDTSILDSVGEHSQVEHIRDFMKCSIPNCGFCHTMDHTAPALCLPGIRQTGVTIPASLSSHHVPRKKGDNSSRPKRKRNVRTEVINLADCDTPAPEACRFEPPLVFPQIGSGIIQDSNTKTWQDTKILFDQGSDESWITKTLAVAMNCKSLGNWEGFLTTVNGRKKIVRHAVEFSIFNFKLRKPMKIQALVSESKMLWHRYGSPSY